ncbi:hypothetical protein BD289DRAFT_295091 [Coniella lustricola]|uniref:Uncharacterized protein n=1 Tax=Coniella lustricola TaxID=2025994 RepID=A0A2T3A519_9PEZI|nr:hypothetical protein BD289DRAFT_295091 [Coniella lustricola]
MKEFQPMVQPTNAAVTIKQDQSNIIKDSFELPTLLAVGGLLQAVTLLILPVRYALLPLGFLLGRSIITTILETRSLSSKPFNPSIVHGITTAQLPLSGGSTSSSTTTTGLQANFGTTSASSPVVVFHLGVYFNHPLGFLAPGSKEIGGHFSAMEKDLLANRSSNGLISSSSWRGTTRSSKNCVLLIAYFRSAEDLNHFAHSKTHRDGWNWYNKFVRESGYHHFGLFHETFVSPKGEWESIYIDCEPTLLGGGSVRIGQGEKEGGEEHQAEEQVGNEDKDDKEVWIRPLVNAKHPALRTQAKRMSSLLGLREEV